MAKPTGIAAEGEVLQTRTPDQGGALKTMPAPATWLDERIGLAKLGKAALRKVFPDHWSFLLGEIALYSFIVLLLTGIFLTIWFRPSMAEIEYQGSYELMRGLHMSQAFESTLQISFDVRGGMLVRQIHHWGAILFMAAMTAHMLRVFFTGAFRKPRELNWLIGVVLLSLGMIAGMTGYSLPDDLLSGTGLRFTDGAIRSIPLVGTWIEFFVFGGEYPGDMIIARFYMAHILLLPAILLGLISAHMALVVYHKHTQFPGPGRTENNVVGYPLFPVYMAKAGGFFFIVLRADPHGRHDVDQPGLALRPVQPRAGHRRLAAGLVHGLGRGRHPHHAGLGVLVGFDDVVVERLHPVRHPHGHSVHRPRRVALR